MALILNIDTSTQTASVCLCENGKPLYLLQNDAQKEHAAWLHVAVYEMIKASGYEMKSLNAVAVTEGPGSYTGLRVGMASAKGFCFGLGIPLITESTLKMMAFAASRQLPQSSALLCPMIDARRMEVYTALYKMDMEEAMPPLAIVLDENSFASELSSQKIFFFGSGAAKWEKISASTRAEATKIQYNASYLGILSYQKFINHQLTDIVYSQPAYIKEFHSYIRK
ncbi:MAG TPA: tRNA (adenosine(37)-N6)-threonylcarbamoyltransferase complex dimerization subunit type 1 TsaB [Puia sp.]|jgi:tRNA threonylcarbamoyladenosine biosynthesis protein TsaB|nr:tRNA (adenosine(37)-N6)-threonylcarbamoyltransferase complex dimerization subunit type 1 TsaB [Puia sp.]